MSHKIFLSQENQFKSILHFVPELMTNDSNFVWNSTKYSVKLNYINRRLDFKNCILCPILSLQYAPEYNFI